MSQQGQSFPSTQFHITDTLGRKWIDQERNAWTFDIKRARLFTVQQAEEWIQQNKEHPSFNKEALVIGW